MKYLLLLLLSFPAMAQYKISIDNDNGSKFRAKFDTIQEAQSWVNENSSDGSWGKNEETKLVSEIQDQSKCKELKDVVSEDPLTSELVTNTYCITKPLYKICGKYYYELDIARDCEDISVQVKAEKDKKDKDALDLEAIKVKLLDNSAKLEDVILYIKIKEDL